MSTEIDENLFELPSDCTEHSVSRQYLIKKKVLSNLLSVTPFEHTKPETWVDRRNSRTRRKSFMQVVRAIYSFSVINGNKANVLLLTFSFQCLSSSILIFNSAMFTLHFTASSGRCCCCCLWAKRFIFNSSSLFHYFESSIFSLSLI